jgi:hypothetical protein
MPKTILYCGYGWATNIGNAFIDFGVQYALEKVASDANVQLVSNSAGWFRHQYDTRIPSFKNKAKNTFDIRTLVMADFCLLGGALFSTLWFKINQSLYDHLVKTQMKVIIYGGGGGNDQNPNENEQVREYLKNLNLFGFISRDRQTFNSFSDIAEYCYDGIDCGFFVNNYLSPIKLTLKDFVIITFDHIDEPSFEITKKIIRLYHAPWDLGRIETIIKSPLKSKNLMVENDMISDYPNDYLNLYANCTETYSDRVHACVATLAYGNKARYYGKSPRSFLFERVGLDTINSELVSLDKEYLDSEKEKQLAFLAKIINK